MGYIRRVKVEDHIALYQEYARKRVKPQSLDTSRGAGKLTSKEQAQEADALSTIVERRLFFSPNSDKLVCATLLGDQHVYLDAWDVRREPSVTITHAPRSFRLPPWTTNDGGLENVFFSPATNGVIFTAFISKEYPVHIPIVPRGNRADEDGDIRPVTFGTKVITAAQSPSGEKFVLANGINELVLLGFKAGGQLAPRRLKNGQAKMVAGAFRHGHVALGMPSDEDVWVLACSWKESGAKMMLRAVKVSVDGETYNEVDIRERFEAVMKEEVEEIVLEKSDAVPPVWDVEAVMLPERHSRAEARIETPTPTPAMDVSGMMMQFDGGVDVPATGSFR